MTMLSDKEKRREHQQGGVQQLGSILLGMFSWYPAPDVAGATQLPSETRQGDPPAPPTNEKKGQNTLRPSFTQAPDSRARMLHPHRTTGKQ